MQDESASGYVIEEQRRLDKDDTERFDRIAYTMRALQMIVPARLTVAVHESRRDLSVARGRAWGGNPGDEWAILGVPPNASREVIANSVAMLAGIRIPSLAYAVFVSRLAED